MRQGVSYPIEDFLEAITAQLDKTQDALRLKSVNRPLTFALKDFNLDLQVFVEMDELGQIMFRPGRPDEQGASTVNIGFTTITRPMIEENTVSLELTKSPTLEEAGLESTERRQLERLGVRNVAQLKNLESQAGDSNLSRMSGVNINKLRQALQMGRPQINRIQVDDSRSDLRQSPAVGPVTGANPVHAVGAIQIEAVPPVDNRTRIPRRLNISDRSRKLKLQGSNLLADGRAPRATLNQTTLNLMPTHEDEVEIELPEQNAGGLLEIELPDGNIEAYQLVVGTPTADEAESDPWMPALE